MREGCPTTKSESQYILLMNILYKTPVLWFVYFFYVLSALNFTFLFCSVFVCVLFFLSVCRCFCGFFFSIFGLLVLRSEVVYICLRALFLIVHICLLLFLFCLRALGWEYEGGGEVHH